MRTHNTTTNKHHNNHKARKENDHYQCNIRFVLDPFLGKVGRGMWVVGVWGVKPVGGRTMAFE